MKPDAFWALPVFPSTAKDAQLKVFRDYSQKTTAGCNCTYRGQNAKNTNRPIAPRHASPLLTPPPRKKTHPLYSIMNTLQPPPPIPPSIDSPEQQPVGRWSLRRWERDLTAPSTAADAAAAAHVLSTHGGASRWRGCKHGQRRRTRRRTPSPENVLRAPAPHHKQHTQTHTDTHKHTHAIRPHVGH